MAAYSTLDHIPDISTTWMNSARSLTFGPAPSNTSGWDNRAAYAGSLDTDWIYSTFRFTALEGATYDFGSQSYFDPDYIRVYDTGGNAIAVNQPDTVYGQDYLLNFVAPYTGTYYVDAGWSQGSASINKTVVLLIQEDVDTAPRAALTGTEGVDLIGDTNGTSTIHLLGGNDFVAPGSGNDTVDGGLGIDTVAYSFGKSNYTITPTTTGVRVTARSGQEGTDSLSNVERLRFADGAVALDIEGNAGQAYRLYQAAFARAPDKGGLGTWINYMDQGHSLKEVSTLFQQSTEFIARYGSNVSTRDFVTLLYQNVLHRTPDAGGMATWSNLLETNQWTRADVLIGFSESPENKAALIGVQSLGMEFIPVA